MKKIISIAAFLACITISVGAQSIKFTDLIGTWEIVGEKGASLQVIDSNTIILTYMGEKKRLTNYSLDVSKSPCWFDFSASDSTSVVKVKSLLDKEGDNIMKWQLFIDEERTPHFSTGKGETFYMRRQRPATGVAASH
jgi:hypothetical protein